MIKITRTILIALLLINLGFANQSKRQNIAVIPFLNLTNDNSLNWMSIGFAEIVNHNFKRVKNITLLERTQIEAILREIHFSLSDLTVDEEVQKAGKLMNADVLVIGSYQKEGENLRIISRLVNVSTGKIMASVETKGAMKNMFTLQDELCGKIISAMNETMNQPDTEPVTVFTHSKAAFEYFARSLDVYDPYTLEGDLNAAINLLKKAIKADPDLAPAHLHLGVLYLNKEGYLAETIKAYQKAIEIDPECAQAYYNLGNIYLFHLNEPVPHKAIDMYVKAIEHYKDFESYEKAQAFVNQAIAFSNLGESEKEIKFLKKAIEINDNVAEAYFNLGMYYFSNYSNTGKNFKLAKDYFLLSIKKSLAFQKILKANSYYFLSYMYVKRAERNQSKNDYRVALNYINQSEQLYPTIKIYLFLKAKIFYHLKEYDKSVNCYNRLLSIKSEEAINLYEKWALRLNSDKFFIDQLEIYKDLGWLYLDKSDYEKAIEVSNKMVEIAYNKSDTLLLSNALQIQMTAVYRKLWGQAGQFYLSGASYLLNQDYEKAINQFKAAIKLRKDFPDAHLGLAMAYRDIGKYERAIDECEICIKLNHEDLISYRILVKLYLVTEQNEKAIQTLQQAVLYGFNDFDNIKKFELFYRIENDPRVMKILQSERNKK